eukprot:1139955-Pelagomonas_calceolata.AAC.5
MEAQGYEDYDLGEDDGVLPTYVARGPLGSSCAPGSGLGSRADDERGWWVSAYPRGARPLGLLMRPRQRAGSRDDDDK